MKVYDKVEWHLPLAGTVKLAVNHMFVLLRWAYDEGLLTKDGIEACYEPAGPDFSLTEDYFNPLGVKIMDACYDKWIGTFIYHEEPSLETFQKKLEELR